MPLRTSGSFGWRPSRGSRRSRPAAPPPWESIDSIITVYGSPAGAAVVAGRFLLARQQGVQLVGGTQTPHGGVNGQIYAAGAWLAQLGALNPGDMVNLLIGAANLDDPQLAALDWMTEVTGSRIGPPVKRVTMVACCGLIECSDAAIGAWERATWG